MYIVVEYYFIENFVLNFLILYITNTVTKSNISIFRVILGAFISALYSLVYFFPSLFFLTSYFMKITISCILIYFLFRSYSLKIFIYQILSFYVISFIFAGIVVSLSWSSKGVIQDVFERGRSTTSYRGKYLFLGFLIGFFMIVRVFQINHKIKIRNNYIFDVEICYMNKSARFKALLDTGNSLVEPFSKKPVLVVEYGQVKSILSETVNKIYESKLLDKSMLLNDKWTNLLVNSNLIILPFKSLGNKEGIILGFKPEYIKIMRESGNIIEDNVIIGIYDGILSSEMNYRGLLNHELIIGGENYEGVKVEN